MFASRRESPLRHVFGLPVQHDVALALVYGATTGGWTAVLCDVSGGPPAVWITVGALVGVACFVQLLWHDGKPAWLIDNVRQQEVREPLFVIRHNTAVAQTPGQVLAALKRNGAVAAYDRRGRRLGLSSRYGGLGGSMRRDARERPRLLLVRASRTRDVTALREALLRSLSTAPTASRPTPESSLEDLVAAFINWRAQSNP